MRKLFWLILFPQLCLAQDWDCTAEFRSSQAAKRLLLLPQEGSFTLAYPDTQHVFTLKPAQASMSLVYRNTSRDKQNFLSYSLLCERDPGRCSGELKAHQQGQDTQRALTSKVSSRSTQLANRNRKVFEMAPEGEGFSVVFFNHFAEGQMGSVVFRCRP